MGKWTTTLLGPTGLQGLGVLVDVLRTRQIAPEDLTPQQAAGPSTKFLELPRGVVAYREEGEGEKTVVLVHGLAGRLETWSALQRNLSRHFRTISLDLWGFGASGRPADLTPEDWPAQVLQVMDVLNVPSASLIGHSMGGRVVMQCAARAPERVERLVLVDADHGQTITGYMLACILARSPLARRGVRGVRSNEKQVRRMLALSYGPDREISEQELWERVSALRVQGTEQCLISLARAWPDRNVRKVPLHITCPSLIIWGEIDRVIPIGWGRQLAAKLPSAELHIIPGAGHLPHEERPEKVNEIVENWLR